MATRHAPPVPVIYLSRRSVRGVLDGVGVRIGAMSIISFEPGLVFLEKQVTFRMVEVTATVVSDSVAAVVSGGIVVVAVAVRTVTAVAGGSCLRLR